MNSGRVRLATADKELAEDILKRIGRKYYIEEISKEIEVYKKSLDWLADRCETLDKIANPTYESICFKAKRWKEIALQKAREEE